MKDANKNFQGHSTGGKSKWVTVSDVCGAMIGWILFLCILFVFIAFYLYFQSAFSSYQKLLFPFD